MNKHSYLIWYPLNKDRINKKRRAKYHAKMDYYNQVFGGSKK